jgi:hypothetical protein
MQQGGTPQPSQQGQQTPQQIFPQQFPMQQMYQPQQFQPQLNTMQSQFPQLYAQNDDQNKRRRLDQETPQAASQTGPLPTPQAFPQQSFDLQQQALQQPFMQQNNPLLQMQLMQQQALQQHLSPSQIMSQMQPSMGSFAQPQLAQMGQMPMLDPTAMMGMYNPLNPTTALMAQNPQLGTAFMQQWQQLQQMQQMQQMQLFQQMMQQQQPTVPITSPTNNLPLLQPIPTKQMEATEPVEDTVRTPKPIAQPILKQEVTQNHDQNVNSSMRRYNDWDTVDLISYRNDYSQRFVDTSGVERPQNYVVKAEYGQDFAHYPKIQKALEERDKINGQNSQPRLFVQVSFNLHALTSSAILNLLI